MLGWEYITSGWPVNIFLVLSVNTGAGVATLGADDKRACQEMFLKQKLVTDVSVKRTPTVNKGSFVS